MATASREFQVMVKPVGAVCNLDCTYCYYLKKQELYPEKASYRMADDLLEDYIVQHIEACPMDLILFSWHGGEPTLLGLDYFRRITELQKKHRPARKKILNAIQTNGTLLNEEWCRFFAARGFHVGISMDGPKELHDGYRVTKKHEATHRQVVNAYRMLRKFRVVCDVLCVVHDRNVRQPTAVYRFFKDLGTPFLQFIPLVVRDGEHGSGEQSVPPDLYGNFLCTIFDEWARSDIGDIVIQNFDEAIRPIFGAEHALCVSRETCGDIVVVEHNGDLYTCDHFVEPEYRLGNIRETPLVELLEHPVQRGFGQRKRDLLPRQCLECEVLKSCNGGCPKDRFVVTADGEEGLNYLCPGFKRFFTHTRPYLERMAEMSRSGAPTEQIRQMVRTETARATGQTGRNAPCPCGSGRKYKKCCLGKLSFDRAGS